MIEELFLLSPIDVVRCFHNAFRRDMSQIDTLALKIAHDDGDTTRLFDRLQVISEILDYHAKGEEEAVFPAIDKIAPLVAQAYILDHRELDNMVNGLDTIREAPDPLTTVRATAVLNSHLRIHLNKEDAYLYPLLRERTTVEEQVSIGRVMASKTPPDRSPIQVQWLFPLLELNDQVTVVRIFMSIMSPSVFTMMKPLIKKSVSANWTMLTQQIPELSDKYT